ncbi:hypothetical protein PFICI_09947 [Pestalotiopsis fici W106-1]|uniref:Uncharacterized protein n=1 Tax=Pestalotiopsis fici (strain W106-1 / CGMCC3.15140) TaxID=1229662 RepID=W3WVL3_PESFW|nr:uncharacterized protein PFICI_09947 [Pestalotiopsis fici W106-1]ETS77885.1 hypothetical protein PFICI_09947 [Pestalotiopsis fici W106-1]
MEAKNCKSAAKMQVQGQAGKTTQLLDPKTGHECVESFDSKDHFRRLETLESGPSADTEETWAHLKHLEDLEAGPKKRERNDSKDEEESFVQHAQVARNKTSLLDKNTASGRAHYEWAVRTGVWEDWVDEADWHESNAGLSSNKK